VTNARRQPRLIQQHRHELAVLDELRVQALDRHRPREADRSDQATEVHGGHPAGGKLVEERVASDDPLQRVLTVTHY
jgi:hypothetical protein